MQITALQTYPVKGMSASMHAHAHLGASSVMPGDRIYAVLHEMSAPADAPPSPNVTLNYLTLSRNPKIGELQSRFDDSSRLLRLYRQGEEVASGHLNNDAERRDIESFLVEHMGETIRGGLRIVERNVEHEGADFSYMGHAQFLSLINLASIAALEEVVGARIDPSRFRANIYFQGETPWEEFKWVGRDIRLGGEARVEVREPIERCAAVNIDPATGAKDMSLVRALFENFGHCDLGVYVRATESGDIAVGDAMEVLPQT
ncbi:MAG: MOSC domain-containing protein [Hyphomicrobiales bacterium]|nr:MOSC domain-containing protein [Hyphomicrobiales bacterium]